MAHNWRTTQLLSLNVLDLAGWETFATVRFYAIAAVGGGVLIGKREE